MFIAALYVANISKGEAKVRLLIHTVWHQVRYRQHVLLKYRSAAISSFYLTSQMAAFLHQFGIVYCFNLCPFLHFHCEHHGLPMDVDLMRIDILLSNRFIRCLIPSYESTSTMSNACINRKFLTFSYLLNLVF